MYGPSGIRTHDPIVQEVEDRTRRFYNLHNLKPDYTTEFLVSTDSLIYKRPDTIVCTKCIDLLFKQVIS
jgi:hypothetical protein